MLRCLIAASAALLTQQAWSAVTVDAPWARATVAGQQVSGAYMTLTSSATAALVGISTPVAETAELHEMRLESGVMRMRAVSDLELPAGRAVALKPGGYHLMLMGLKRPLHAGEQIPLKLEVRRADGKTETVDVKAAVRDAAKPDHTGHHHH